jgi:hypothetical protein
LPTAADGDELQQLWELTQEAARIANNATALTGQIFYVQFNYGIRPIGQILREEIMRLEPHLRVQLRTRTTDIVRDAAKGVVSYINAKGWLAQILQGAPELSTLGKRGWPQFMRRILSSGQLGNLTDVEASGRRELLIQTTIASARILRLGRHTHPILETANGEVSEPGIGNRQAVATNPHTTLALEQRIAEEVRLINAIRTAAGESSEDPVMFCTRTLEEIERVPSEHSRQDYVIVKTRGSTISGVLRRTLGQHGWLSELTNMVCPEIVRRSRAHPETRVLSALGCGPPRDFTGYTIEQMHQHCLEKIARYNSVMGGSNRSDTVDPE